MGFTGVYNIFLISAQKHRLWVLEAVLTSTHNLWFEQKYEKYQIFFLSENFQFLEVKFSIDLNRRVFVMADCADEQAVLSYCWAHTSEDTLSFFLFIYAFIDAHAYRLKVHFNLFIRRFQIQSTPVISKSTGPTVILRDIHTSTYQICRIEEKINRTTTFHKWVYNLTPEVRDILKILWKSGEIAPFSFPQYFVSCC